MLVLVLVCITGQPCDTTTARAVEIYRAPPGVLICGIPAMLPLQNEALLAQAGEETHIKCRVGRR